MLAIPTEHSVTIGLELELDRRLDGWTDIFQQHSLQCRPMVPECSVGIVSIRIVTRHRDCPSLGHSLSDMEVLLSLLSLVSLTAFSVVTAQSLLCFSNCKRLHVMLMMLRKKKLVSA